MGCITPNRYPGIEAATRRALSHFNVQLLDMKGASCCPAPGVFGSFDLLTWLVVAARNISIAEAMQVDIVTTCNGCYATFHDAIHLLTGNEELKAEVNNYLSKIGKEYKGTSRVKHVVEALRDDVGFNRVASEVVKPLSGLKAALHYGCHFLKPSRVRQHGTPERPKLLDELMHALGGQSVDYQDQMMCCGAGGGVRAGRLKVALDFTKDKVENATKSGANCMVDICAFCHLQLDRGQVELAKTTGKDYKLPVLFVTQLVGLAIGLKPEELGLQYHQVPVQGLLREMGSV